MGFFENLKLGREAKRQAMLEKMYQIYARSIHGNDLMDDNEVAAILEFLQWIKNANNKLMLEDYVNQRANGIPLPNEIVVTQDAKPSNGPDVEQYTLAPLSEDEVTNNYTLSDEEEATNAEEYYNNNIEDPDYWLGLHFDADADAAWQRYEQLKKEKEQKVATRKRKQKYPATAIYEDKNGAKFEVPYAQKGTKASKPTTLEEQIQLYFALNLGAALGALDEQTALQYGLYGIEALGESAKDLFQAWYTQESKLQGSGVQFLALLPVVEQLREMIGLLTRRGATLALPRYNKLGAKFEYISSLNGKCPEGYEVEKYLLGGCVKCRRGKLLKKLFSSTKRFGKGGKDNEGKTEKMQFKNNSGTRITTYQDHKGTATVSVPKNSNDSAFLSQDIINNAPRNVELGTEKARREFYKKLDNYNKLASKKANGGIMESIFNPIELYKCGGKKRIKKGEDGVETTIVSRNSGTGTAKRSKRNNITRTVTEDYYDDSYRNGAKSIEYLGAKHKSMAIITKNKNTQKNDTAFHGSGKTEAEDRARFYEHQALYNRGTNKASKKLNGGELNVENLYAFFKKGGKNLSKKKMNSLKHSGGPGDINSTLGMHLNSKLKEMLKCGGKAKKKETGGSLNTSWLNTAAGTNKGSKMIKADKCGGKAKKTKKC